VLIVNPNNPTGSFVHAAEYGELAALCRDRDLALISDEVFLDYPVEGSGEVSAAFSGDCLSFALGGLSKLACLPQMKLAWVVVSGPEELRREAHARLEVIADTYLSVGAPIQHALAQIFPFAEAIQRRVSERVSSNLGLLDTELTKTAAVQRFKVEGGWYAVLRVPVRQSDEELAISLMEKAEVVVHPGHFYDFPQDGYLILSLIAPEAEFAEGARRIVEIV
jgi:aspartate/methionine/tyrosine aminotransferase